MSDSDSFVETAKSYAREPGAGILRGYTKRARASRAKREEGDPDFEEEAGEVYFHDMLERTRQIFSRYTIYRTDDHGKAANKTFLTDRTLKHTRPNLKIVCVSSELDIWSETKLKMQTMRDGCRILYPQETLKPGRWIENRLAELDAALKHDPDIVVFPEFAYPPPSPTPNGGWTVDEISETVGQRVEFERRALERVGREDVFLVLGSFHCIMTLYNVGVVFPWGSHRSGQADYLKHERRQGKGGIVRPVEVPETDLVRGPVLYRKRFPARKIGEQTRVPPGRDFNVFKCGFGNVLVLICSDVLDINQFMTIIQQSLEHKDFDYILIPAYNPGASFNKICRDLSFLAATTVIVANASDESVDLTESEIYVCGKSVAELSGEAVEELRKMVEDVAREKVGHSTLRVFDLDLTRVRQARANQIDILDPNDGPQRAKK